MPRASVERVALLEISKENDIPIETIVKKTSHAVADRYGIVDRGYIREGYWADLVLVDSKGSYEVTSQNILYECGWSPFEGHRFDASIEMTFINGLKVFENGKILSEPSGMKLDFKS